VAHQTVGHAGLAEAYIRANVCAGPDAAPAPDCPVEVTLGVLRGRWMPLVLLRFLREGALGFSDLAASLGGLSDKVLSERLARLTDAGVIVRHRTPGWPPRVTYELTPRGRALAPVLQAMWLWGHENGRHRSGRGHEAGARHGTGRPRTS
jgi:DNA-binding HxlR family transcriptional regulator